VVWLEDALKLCHLRLPIEDSFDLVYTSNLSDYLGLLNVILAGQPRLKRQDWRYYEIFAVAYRLI